MKAGVTLAEWTVLAMGVVAILKAQHQTAGVVERGLAAPPAHARPVQRERESERATERERERDREEPATAHALVTGEGGADLI